MKIQVATLATMLVFGPSFGAAHAQTLAQTGDAAYCKALADTYTTYVHDRNAHRPMSANVSEDTAIAKCGAGDTATGIPVLEKALHDAGVALPTRG